MASATSGGGGGGSWGSGGGAGPTVPTPGLLETALNWYNTNIVQPYVAPVVYAATDFISPAVRALSPGAQAAYNAGTASVAADRALAAQQQLSTAQTAQNAISAGYKASPTQQKEILTTLGNYKNTMGTAKNPPGINDMTTGTYPKQDLAQPIPNVEEFTFDWVGEVQRAYDSLQNFYSKLLDFAGGRVDLAKRLLEYSYQQGMRETSQDFENETGILGREKALAIPAMQTAQNRRGVYSSGFGTEERRMQDEGFAARQLSLERAKQNKESRLTTERDLGVQEQNMNLEEGKFNLERQRRKEAQEMAGYERSVKSDKYNAQLTKQAQEEQRNIQNITARATGQITGGSTTSSSGEPGTKWTGKDQFGREYGGWYWQPQLGKAQRWWGNGQWTDQ